MVRRPIEVESETNSSKEKGGVITIDLVRKHGAAVGYCILTSNLYYHHSARSEHSKVSSSIF